MKPYHKNPRQITKKQFSDLERWLQELGDLSGIVHDLNSDEIVAGNQRGRVFDINQCEIVKVQEFDEPDEQGTVALGYVVWQGKRYGYRAVRWTERQCEQANVVANRAGGEWDWDVLANQFDVGDLKDWGFTDFDFQMAGVEFDKPEPPIFEASPIYSDEQIIDAAFEYFRKAGFPYRSLPVHVCMQEINKLATTEWDKLANSSMAYHVADTYHPHRFIASAEGKRSPVESFGIDKSLRHALSLTLQYGGVIGEKLLGSMLLVRSTQACSNFRPGFACYLYRKYAESGDIVLDCSTGYGGRLVGFIASGIAGKYIGIDPNTLTHEGNMQLANDLGFSDSVELYNLPAEDIDSAMFAGRCDFAFTSPPYFAKEHYSNEDTQSWVRYKTGAEWRSGFLVPFMALQFIALKPGKTAIVNIADVKLRGEIYPLKEWTCVAGESVGFEYIRTDVFKLTRRFGAGMDDEIATEPVIVFRKPSVSSG